MKIGSIEFSCNVPGGKSSCNSYDKQTLEHCKNCSHFSVNVRKVEPETTACSTTTGSTPHVDGSLSLNELRKLFHQCWTDNASGVYSKRNWSAFQSFLEINLKCEI